MNLFQKGILLIATPIVAQFVFVLVLLGAYRTSEEVTWKDLQYRSQTAELMNITILCYKAVGVLSFYGLTRDQTVIAGFDNIYESLVRKSEDLSLLSEEGNDLAEEVQVDLRKSIKSLSAAKQLVGLKQQQISNKVVLARELERDLQKLLLNMERLIAQRSKAGAADVAGLERSRWIFLSMVIGGFALNMLMCAMLLGVYARDFATRFAVIVDNTRRLPHGLPLNNPVGGKDELTELDSGFHDMNTALKEAEERKNQLISMVTHDLRNPLTAIGLNLEVVDNLEKENISPVVAAKVKSSLRMVKRLNSLINDILDMEKLRAGKLAISPSIIDARAKIDECVKELESVAAKASIALDNKAQGLMVVADGERITQVLVNLIGNAIKYSPPDSVVTIDAAAEDAMVRFTVKDLGPGVPEQYRRTIFLPYEQVPDDKRPKTGSTGLGLPICKMLIDLHGGTIGVDVNNGSAFWFTLPQAVLEEI